MSTSCTTLCWRPAVQPSTLLTATFHVVAYAACWRRPQSRVHRGDSSTRRRGFELTLTICDSRSGITKRCSSTRVLNSRSWNRWQEATLEHDPVLRERINTPQSSGTELPQSTLLSCQGTEARVQQGSRVHGLPHGTRRLRRSGHYRRAFSARIAGPAMAVILPSTCKTPAHSSSPANPRPPS